MFGAFTNYNPTITGIGGEDGTEFYQGIRVKITYVPNGKGSRYITVADADDNYDGFTINKSYFVGSGPHDNPFNGDEKSTTIFRRGIPVVLPLAMSSAGTAGQIVYADTNGKHTTVTPGSNPVVIGTLTKDVPAPATGQIILGEVDIRVG